MANPKQPQRPDRYDPNQPAGGGSEAEQRERANPSRSDPQRRPPERDDPRYAPRPAERTPERP